MGRIGRIESRMPYTENRVRYVDCYETNRLSVYRQTPFQGMHVVSAAARCLNAYQINRTVPRQTPNYDRCLLPDWLTMGWLLIALTVSTMGCGARRRDPPPTAETSSDDPKAALQGAITVKDWAAALAVSQQAMIAHPGDADVLTNVAIATAQTGNRVEAAELLVEAVRATDYDKNGGRIENAIAGLLDVGHLYDAIDLLQDVVQQHPDAASYRRMLVGFLSEAQLTEDAAEHMQALIQQREFDLPLLLATTETSSRRFAKSTIELLLQRNPNDLRPRLGEAKQFLDQRDAKGAETVLREILREHPDFAAAHAMLGVALVAQGKRDALSEWHESVAEGAYNYSGYWIALGDWASSKGDLEGAVRAMSEATRLAPNESAYWPMLATALRQWQSQNPTSDEFDMEAVAAGITDRQTDLLTLRDQFAAFKGDGQTSQKKAVSIAKTLSELGRLWEAEAWLAVATTLQEDPAPELTSFRESVIQRLTDDRDWQSTQFHPELAFDVSRFGLPDHLHDDQEDNPQASERLSLSNAKSIRMHDAAASLGVSFYGRVGDSVEGPRIPITQTLGCGGGMIDFDQDGRQDLIFAAAGGRLRERDSDPGALFRNQDTFVDVTQATGFGDTGYSHGIAVGDFNDDGFADVLVLNLGPNRLFQNNGDGSFRDASGLLGDQSESQWSTSGAILDVNGDGHNDIVIVNYCDSRDPLEQPCFDSAGRQINCYPREYRAAQDQILAGQGDGSFVDKTAEWIAQATLGRGLGIVAGRLDGQQQCVYVVNDASPNTFYRWFSSANKLLDQGIASGLAVDGQSLDQGSMGIAASDFDHDGDLDLYVTGFSNEYNILYEQQSPGFWADGTASKGLVDPTLRTVGFGSEAMDLDNDGIDEIVVTNGHVGIFNPPLPGYAQPFQVFRVDREGRYESIDLRAWGGYFDRPHVGRSLFTGDINGDGMADAVVTHATEPVAVLVNDSERTNHRIAFRLIDREQCRDAVGAIVEFELGDEARPMTRRLYQLAGHGYLCSNQQLLWAGTGSADEVRQVKVTWPDGNQQMIGTLQTDATYLVVRDQSPYPLTRYAEAMD